METRTLPLLSIIIPTKNRSQYVIPCVQSLMQIESDDIEIVIQDNSDDSKTIEAISKLGKDKRLIYHHSDTQLSMSDNFTHGFESSSGEYVAFIGDDDGINPNLVNLVRWAKSKKLHALVGSSTARYYWPDIHFSLYGDKFSASLLVKPFSNLVTYPDSAEELKRCLKRAGDRYGMLPKAYHGVVLRNQLDSIKQQCGTYFPGPTPDMASAIALSMAIERYAHFDYPLFIVGTGRGSAGGAGVEKKHDWDLESVPWFSRKAIEKWSNIVPRYASGSTLWGEDVIQALKAMGSEERILEFNALLLFARCYAFDSQYKLLIFKSLNRYIQNNGLNIILSYMQFLGYYITTWSSRLGALIQNVMVLNGLSRISKISDIQSIMEAASIMGKYDSKLLNEISN